MSIKPVLVPDQDAKTLRALLESFDAAASGTAKKQLTESTEQGVAEAKRKLPAPEFTAYLEESLPSLELVAQTD